MSRLFFLIFAFILSLCTSINMAYAQGAPNAQTSYYANPRYNFLARQAMLNMSAQFRFDQLRSNYMRTSQYDPIADKLIERMQKLAFTMQEGSDEEERNSAAVQYRTLVMEHLGNLRVVVQALSFAKLNPKSMGSAKFFTWLRDGITNDVLISGDGKTLQGAYDVMTLSEETVLLGSLGVRVLGTQTNHEGSYYYNMHEVEALGTGQRSTLFVNTTFPMKFLNANEFKGTNRFDIQRQ